MHRPERLDVPLEVILVRLERAVGEHAMIQCGRGWYRTRRTIAGAPERLWGGDGRQGAGAAGIGEAMAVKARARRGLGRNYRANGKAEGSGGRRKRWREEVFPVMVERRALVFSRFTLKRTLTGQGWH